MGETVRDITTILPNPGVLKFDRLVSTARCLIHVVFSRRKGARCPDCGVFSERIHGRYERTIADLPMAGIEVELELHVRKFFCDSAACPRRVFTKRLAGVVKPHGRKTERLTETIRLVG